MAVGAGDIMCTPVSPVSSKDGSDGAGYESGPERSLGHLGINGIDDLSFFEDGNQASALRDHHPD